MSVTFRHADSLFFPAHDQGGACSTTSLPSLGAQGAAAPGFEPVYQSSQVKMDAPPPCSFDWRSLEAVELLSRVPGVSVCFKGQLNGRSYLVKAEYSQQLSSGCVVAGLPSSLAGESRVFTYVPDHPNLLIPLHMVQRVGVIPESWRSLIVGAASCVSCSHKSEGRVVHGDDGGIVESKSEVTAQGAEAVPELGWLAVYPWMDPAECITWDTLLARSDKYTAVYAFDRFREVLEALHHLEVHGYAHCNLIPGSILVYRDTVFVRDLGLARPTTAWVRFTGAAPVGGHPSVLHPALAQAAVQLECGIGAGLQVHYQVQPLFEAKMLLSQLLEAYSGDCGAHVLSYQPPAEPVEGCVGTAAMLAWARKVIIPAKDCSSCAAFAKELARVARDSKHEETVRCVRVLRQVLLFGGELPGP